MIFGENVRLELIKKEDLENICDLNNSIKYFSFNNRFIRNIDWYNRRFEEDCFWNGEEGWLKIIYKNNLVGQIGCFKSDLFYSSFSLHYHLYDEINFNKGIMTESIKILTDFIFNNFSSNVVRVFATTYFENKSSIRCLESNGFVMEASFKDAMFIHGKLGSIVFLSKFRKS